MQREDFSDPEWAWLHSLHYFIKNSSVRHWSNSVLRMYIWSRKRRLDESSPRCFQKVLVQQEFRAVQQERHEMQEELLEVQKASQALAQEPFEAWSSLSLFVWNKSGVALHRAWWEKTILLAWIGRPASEVQEAKERREELQRLRYGSGQAKRQKGTVDIGWHVLHNLDFAGRRTFVAHQSEIMAAKKELEAQKEKVKWLCVTKGVPSKKNRPTPVVPPVFLFDPQPSRNYGTGERERFGRGAGQGALSNYK